MTRVIIQCDRCGDTLGEGRDFEAALYHAYHRRQPFGGHEYCAGCLAVIRWTLKPVTARDPMPPDPIRTRHEGGR